MYKSSFPDPPTLKPLFEKLRKEKEEGKVEEKLKIAEVMLKNGYADEEIIKLTSITEDELEEIKNQME